MSTAGCLFGHLEDTYITEYTHTNERWGKGGKEEGKNGGKEGGKKGERQTDRWIYILDKGPRHQDLCPRTGPMSVPVLPAMSWRKACYLYSHRLQAQLELDSKGQDSQGEEVAMKAGW